ncbi:LOW QUALITY PROTEIN: uncharacterized protein LOC119441677 [Dermacentor silvarum]|uniref:LOW QUALITY PROTEIN: uncharacterized protein LOC119441677 n=1 Tax=Dermacentor silvarum TaxID=543639 RepID=UPI002100EDCC|nr:LOW QUALITY PROTEIN: uncharacterized protein LOC119441677 [Dermacentor silvarum]
MRARIEDGVVYSPFPAVDIPCCSFYDAAKQALLDQPEKLALADGSVAVTRGELFVLMQRYAAGFQKHGVQPGDRVCVHLANSVNNFAAMWGCVFAGASVTLARASLAARELHYQLADSDSTHILTEDAFTEKVLKAATSVKLKGFFTTGVAGGFVSTATFPELEEALFREVPVEDPRNCVLVICYTSGTTGLPKGVVATHYAVVANMATAGPCLPWGASDVVLNAAPITHGSGFNCITFGVLLGATTVMATPGATLTRIDQLVSQYKVTAISVPPAHLRAVLAEMKSSGNPLKGVRRISIGGGVFPEAYKEAQSAFVDFECLTNAYAMSESMGIVCSPSIHAVTGIDVGFPAPSSEIKVVDILTRKKLGPNQVGEICFRTPTVMKEYYKRPKETAEVFDQEGWCKSGDAGYYDEYGRVYIVQRLKEMIKCMDTQVVPAELEELLYEEHSEYISEVVVVGLPHPEYGQAPAAVVVLKQPSTNEHQAHDIAQKIKATISDNLAVNKRLYGGVFFMETLPKTGTGKVKRSCLVEECARTMVP